MQLELIPCSQAVCGLLGVGMDCLNPPETGFYYMDDSEIRVQLRFSWSLTGTLSMCLQDPSQLLPRHSKPDAPHSRPPVPAPLPAVLGLVDGDISTMGSSSLRDPGLGELPGDAARGLLLSPVPKKLSQWALSATPKR